MKGFRLLRPYTLRVWHAFLCIKGRTIVGVIDVDNVEVGVIDGSSESFEPHFVVFGEAVLSFIIDGGLGQIEKRIDERAFAGMLSSQYNHWLIIKFLLRTRFV